MKHLHCITVAKAQTTDTTQTALEQILAALNGIMPIVSPLLAKIKNGNSGLDWGL